MSQSQERKRLMDELLAAVKQCQIRFGGRTELATELDERVVNLCNSLEAIFLHGLKNNRSLLNLTSQVARGLGKSFLPTSSKSLTNNGGDITYWHFIRLHLNKHEYERYLCLRNVHSDLGRGRAWLRSVLNDNAVERYMLTMLGDGYSLRSQFYEDWAILLDEEKNSMLPTIARGLSSILFAINIDNPDLNGSSVKRTKPVDVIPNSDHLPVVVAGSARTDMTESQNRRSRRGPRVQVISLNDDEEELTTVNVNVHPHSAPSTSLSPEIERSMGHLDSGCYQANERENISDAESEESANRNLHLTPIGAEDSASVGDLIVSTNDMLINSGEEEERISCNGVLDGNSCNSNGPTTETNQQLIEQIEILKIESLVTQKKWEEKVARLEMQVESGVKENNILKLHLKNYIAAVQMLKSGNANVDGNTESPRPQSDLKSSYCYYQEAAQYEKKLVQVAEMHGELVEFNDRLHRVIMQKDAIVKRLRDELVELRGPLPDGNEITEDEISVTSDFSSSFQSLPLSMSRPLVNIWIPTAFLSSQQKSSSSSHHVYQIYVRIKDDEWNVYRRYSEFHSFHKSIRKKHPVIRTLDFPPKKTIGNKDAKVVQERRKRLESYLRSAVNLIQLDIDLMDKTTLVSVLPFLGDRKSPNITGDTRSRSDTHLNRLNPTAQHHYSGL